MRTHLLALVTCLVGCSKPGAVPEAKEAAPPVAAAPTAAVPPPTAPGELAVPAGHSVTLAASARGVQIYECAADASGTLAWKLRAPRADLLDDTGAQIGVHFGGIDKGLPPGPYWEAVKDASRVHGAKPVSVPNPGSIPLLRLEAADTNGTGVFSKVAFIQRLDTTGGAAPAGACTAGQTTEVPYTAKYYFYSTP